MAAEGCRRRAEIRAQDTDSHGGQDSWLYLLYLLTILEFWNCVYEGRWGEVMGDIGEAVGSCEDRVSTEIGQVKLQDD